MNYPGIALLENGLAAEPALSRKPAPQRGLMETVSPARYDGAWLAGGRLPISADPPLARLMKGVERVASIRAEIAQAAKVATMPAVEVVPYIWTRGRVLICGRVTALHQGNGAYFGVQIPAPTALCTDRAAVRALLVHEFAHWFYIATRVVNGSELGKKEGGVLDLRNEGLTESDTQIDARDWFGEEDAQRFIQHGDSTTRSISSQAAGLEEHFYVVSPRMGDTVGGIDISDDVKAHIRSLRVARPSGSHFVHDLSV
jgi:hypothetical protein